MKAIIIDDEKHVRDVLRMLAQWESFGIDEVLEARDGEEAKKLIEAHRPEIVFTDMNMPNLDGIGLLEWLRRNAEGSKTIVISAYDDYHYMRNAIFYGSFDYILKPMEASVVNETLARAVEEWRREADSRLTALEKDRLASAAKPLYWEGLLSGLLNRAPAPDAEEKLEREYGAVPGRDDFAVWLLSVRAYAAVRFDGNVESAFAALLPVCNDCLQANGGGIAFRNVAARDELAILAWNPKDGDALVRQLADAIWQAARMRLLLAAGRPAKQPADAYDSARLALMRCDLLEVARTKPPVRAEEVGARPVLHLLDYAPDLKWALQSGSADGMDRLLERIYGKLREAGGMTLEQLDNWESQYALLRATWLQEYGIHDSRETSRADGYWKEDGSFSFDRFREAKRRQLHELLRMLHDVRFRKERNSIQDIEAYLRQNYKREVTLQEIAERFYLSREYISRKFRQEFGKTITDYVTQVRIDKAKELLENPHLKVYEIAEFVGYQNDKYFIKVFKRAEGVTPSEYGRARAEAKRAAADEITAGG